MGADFLVFVIASKVGPNDMGPFVCEEGWGSFFLQCNLENRQLGERGNDLSHRQTGGGLAKVSAGSGRRVKQSAITQYKSSLCFLNFRGVLGAFCRRPQGFLKLLSFSSAHSSRAALRNAASCCLFSPVGSS